MRLIGYYLVIFVLSMVLCAASGYTADFSADMISKSSETAFTAKLFVSGDKSRVDTPEGITISRMDKKVVWVLMPQQMMYMEQPLDQRSAASTQERVDGEIERKIVVNEKVNGRNTTKYLVTYKAKDKNESLFQWIDETVRIPVKTAAVDGSWSNEFKNIQTGPQDAGLFEIPSGYKKMSFGIGNIKDIMGSMNY